MDSLFTGAIFLILLAVIAVPYWRKTMKKREEIAKKHETAVAAGLNVIATLHPRIDILSCIGCGSCVKACPEDVLGLVNGKAAIINGARCVGHAVCAEACPVIGIIMGFGKPRQGMELPFYDDNFETNISGLYIVGELGGLGLIRNASSQGAKAIQHIASKPRAIGELYDVAIIGAGPAGFSAALAATELKLRYIVLEQNDLGGSILHYPRQKLVLTNPIVLPLYGTISKSELAKEELMHIFTEAAGKFSLNIRPSTKVDAVVRNDGFFSVKAGNEEIRSAHVMLALGRRGSPRKLGVPGEELQKVAYQLIEAESYQSKHLLVVGGGDSAVEAAIGLSRQKGNTVTMSYRRDNFVRLKEKNDLRIREAIKKGSVIMHFESNVAAITPDAVELELKDQPDAVLKNDQVFIFAGGELPGEFLKAIGIKMRTEESEQLLETAVKN